MFDDKKSIKFPQTQSLTRGIQRRQEQAKLRDQKWDDLPKVLMVRRWGPWNLVTSTVTSELPCDERKNTVQVYFFWGGCWETNTPTLVHIMNLYDIGNVTGLQAWSWRSNAVLDFIASPCGELIILFGALLCSSPGSHHPQRWLIVGTPGLEWNYFGFQFFQS